MELTPAQWDQVKTLFESALEQDVESRASFLARRCPDPEVRSELDRLLADFQEMGSFIGSPALANLAQPSQPLKTVTLVAGEILAERFRIIRFIARGGMGEIYEAADLELQSRVAIKVIRPELLRPPFLEQFKKEVQLAKQVTHPNVCRIYDLFRHRRPGEGRTAEVFFISMELLRGETLAERLRQSGRLTVAEARGIIVQIADALDAAHAASILHRDLKPENIVLVPQYNGGPVRAVVTDFGLALQSESLNVEGLELAGTPAYMSPEQLKGTQLTTASDIYSLGLVIYRMVTGVRAFEEGDSTQVSLRRVTEQPLAPREFVPNLDRRSNAVILRCLEPEPSRRYQTARQVTEAWWGREPAPVPTVVRIALSTLLAALATILIWLGIWRHSAFHGESPPSHRRVAVLGFRNASRNEEADWISAALSVFLTAELTTGSKLETTGDEEVARLKADLSLPDSDVLPKDVLDHIRTGLRADVVVLGSYQQDEKGVRLTLRILDTAGKLAERSIQETGYLSNLFDLFARGGSRLRDALNAGPLLPHDEDEVRATLPSSVEAFRLYARGLLRIEHFDVSAARDILAQAVRADPQYPLGHSALAEAWSGLGYDERATEEAKSGFDLSGSLSWRDRQLVEGRYRELSKQWDLAAEIYRRLWSTYPDEVDYGLHLASVQTSAGRTTAALTTVTKLRSLAKPASDDPRIDLAEALAAQDLKTEQLAASRAAGKAAARSQRQLLAAALREEGWALGGLGKRNEAVEALNHSKRIYSDLGDRAHAAFASLNLATVLDGFASPASRKGLIREAVEVFRAIGCRRGEGVALNNLAGILEDTGDLDGALKTYRAAGAVFIEIGERPQLATVRNNIGSVLEIQGNLPGASKEYEASLAVFRSLKDRGGCTGPLGNIAGILHKTGRLSAAGKMWDEVIVVSREIGSEDAVASSLSGKGDVLAAEGRLALARKRYEEAVAIYRKIDVVSGMASALNKLAAVRLDQGDVAATLRFSDEARQLQIRSGANYGAADSHLVAARVLLEQGKGFDAQIHARTAVQQLIDSHNAGDEMTARLVLARCLLAEDKPAEARSELHHVAAFLKGSQNRFLRTDFLISSARLEAASGRVFESLEIVKTALRESEEYGFAGFHLEAQLAKGEIEAKTADKPAATRDLAEVQRDAEKAGYALISAKASKAFPPR